MEHRGLDGLQIDNLKLQIANCWKSYEEIAACRPWLDAELEVIQPKILVCLGATAAQGLLGRDFRVSRQRGQWIQSNNLK